MTSPTTGRVGSALGAVGLWICTAFRAVPAATSVMCVIGIVAAVLSPLAVYGVKLAIDAQQANRPLTPGLFVISAVLLVATLTASAQFLLGEYVDSQTNRFVLSDLLRLTNRVPSLAHFEDPGLADRLALLQRDAGQLGGIFRLLGILGGCSSVVTVAVMLWTVHPFLVLLLLSALVPSFVSARGLYRRQQLWRDNEKYRRFGTKITDALLDPDHGVEVRAFGLHRTLIEISRWAFEARAVPWNARTKEVAIQTAAAWVVFGVGYFVVAIWIIERARSGSTTTGDVVLTLLIGPQVAAAASMLTMNVATVLTAVDVFSRYAWLRRYAAEHDWADATGSPGDVLRTGITFEHVSFSYPGLLKTQGPCGILRDISVHLPAGATVALVGANGAGKSTMIKLLARLYDPTSGTILVDGQPLAEVSAQAWRQRVSAGFQDFSRLELLARESVGVGDLPHVQDRTRVTDALARGQAEGIVGILPKSMDTQLGVRFADGVGLSGGQWQRLAMARAFMRQTPLLVLLDEPSAALDPEAEQRLYKQFQTVARSGTSTGAITVLVSHRFSTVQMADLIIVIGNGTISELGNHAELMAAGQGYAQLFTRQAEAYR